MPAMRRCRRKAHAIGILQCTGGMITAALRKECIKARRAKTRARKEGRKYNELNEKYKRMQLELIKSIKASKRQCWNELLQEVDGDVWGRPYKLAMKRLKSQAMPSSTCPVHSGLKRRKSDINLGFTRISYKKYFYIIALDL